MAASAGSSLLLSSLLYAITLSGLQICAKDLASSKGLTILGGFISSLLFLFSLIAINSFEALAFHDSFKSKWPEVIFALVAAVLAASTVHGVCATTCVLFSGALLYLTYRVSEQTYHFKKS
mmetsp:Transcript_32490/g.52633  ORF Transcript_32490/g.52633 Transcript_32490/m.52633 type:complete len:121 (+) Transcript_32490:66-428(+)